MEERETAPASSSDADTRPELSSALDVIRSINGRYLEGGDAPGRDDLDVLRRQQSILRTFEADDAGALREGWNDLVRLYDACGCDDDVLAAVEQALERRLGSPEAIMRFTRVAIEVRGARAALDATRDLALDRVNDPGVQAMIAKAEYEAGEFFLARSRARRVLAGAPRTSMATGILVLASLGLTETVQAARAVLEGNYALDCPWAILPLLVRLGEEPGAASLRDALAERFLEDCTQDRTLWEATIQRLKGRSDAAVRLVREGLERHPDDARWRIERLRLHLDSRRWHVHRDAIERMLEGDGLDPELRARAASAMRCVELLESGSVLARADWETPAAGAPDSLIEHVLASHRNAVYVPVLGKVALLIDPAAVADGDIPSGRIREGWAGADGDAHRWLLGPASDRTGGAGRVPATVLPHPPHVPEPFSWLPAEHAANAYRVYLKILDERPEVIHSRGDGTNAELVFAAVLAGVRRIVLHVSAESADSARGADARERYGRVYAAAAGRADVRLACASEACRIHHLHWIGRANEDRIHVIGDVPDPMRQGPPPHASTTGVPLDWVAPAPVKYMMVMPWGRVGSNLLLSVLGQFGSTRSANESFNRIRTEREQLEWLDGFYGAQGGGEAEAGERAVACKQSLYAMADPASVERFCEERHIRIVRMARADLLKAAVSQMRAKQYAERTLEEEGRARWGVSHDATPLGPTSLCPETFSQVVSIMRNTQRELLGRFDRCRVIDVEYEQLNAELDVTVRRVAAFLDLEVGPYDVAFRKATTDDTSEVVVNYAEIVETFGRVMEEAADPTRMAA